MRVVKLFLLCVFIAALSFSCCSIIHGTKQDISISSSPDKADVSITREGGDVVYTGKTPTVTKLQRKFEYDVLIKLSGYKVTKVHIFKNFDALYLGNIICGGIIGLIIDAANGAMSKLEPESINVTLVRAYLGDNKTETYAVLRTINNEGELQTLVIPMIKIQ